MNFLKKLGQNILEKTSQLRNLVEQIEQAKKEIQHVTDDLKRIHTIASKGLTRYSLITNASVLKTALEQIVEILEEEK